MGFFSRKGAASQRGHRSQEEQLAELRRRARRRLIGALVLVLIAVIIVPIFLKSDGAEEVEQVVQVFPPIIAPKPQGEGTGWQRDDGFTAVEESAQDLENAVSVDEPSAEVVTEIVEQQSTAPLPEISVQTEAQVAQATPQKPAEPKPSESAKAAPTPQPKPQPQKAENKPKAAEPVRRKQEPERTDDGSVALALLEGRIPVESVTGTQQARQRGAYTVQVAAYSSREGANSRRDQLISAGVNNAYIEQSGGTYRLRVGPFESRQAAEAALTRLRSLGYDDSFIRSQ